MADPELRLRSNPGAASQPKLTAPDNNSPRAPLLKAKGSEYHPREYPKLLHLIEPSFQVHTSLLVAVSNINHLLPSSH